MYVIDTYTYTYTYTYYALLTCDLLAGITYATLAFALLRSKRVGGLHFCKMGRLGFCFYFTKNTSARTVTNHKSSLPVVER